MGQENAMITALYEYEERERVTQEYTDYLYSVAMDEIFCNYYAEDKEMTFREYFKDIIHEHIQDDSRGIAEIAKCSDSVELMVEDMLEKCSVAGDDLDMIYNKLTKMLIWHTNKYLEHLCNNMFVSV